MMRGLVLLLLFPTVFGFQAGLSRRDALSHTGAAFVAGVVTANTILQQFDSNSMDPSKQATAGKLEYNGAFVGDDIQLPGVSFQGNLEMASNGPYKTGSNLIEDISIIPEATEKDKKLFSKTDEQMTVNPRGGVFREHITGQNAT